MRRNIVHIGADELSYEIREVVEVGKRLEKLGIPMIWENIGDPVTKGEKVPGWIKGIMVKLSKEDESYAYCPTQGVDSTREFLAQEINRRGGALVTRDDIIFFNGLGDAVARMFGFLRREARVLGPSPAYSTHSSAEAAHSGYEHLTYRLDPDNNWQPDLEDMRNKVKYNDSITGILIINPDNPTGAVYPREVLQEIVKIAKEYDLFLICDEIYANVTYNGYKMVHLSEVIGDVCGIGMRGVSKQVPWPGARCGWIEVYNQDKDPMFRKYIQSLVNAKMLEVCSTTLPQRAIPLIFKDERYKQHLQQRNALFEQRANKAYEILHGTKGITVNKPGGAFYMTIVFDKGVLNNQQSLPIQDKQVEQYIQELTKDVPNDKRFVYYLMASTGICVVPLTGFCCDLEGFRITLLESDALRFEKTILGIKQNINIFINGT